MPELVSVYDLDYSRLQDLLVSMGEPAFRAKQVWEWLYRSLATEWQQMTNLPASLRERLGQTLLLPVLSPKDERVSAADRTRKILLELRDGCTIEAVLMRYRVRRTVCVSTQVGCAVGCPVCATGAGGFERNLSPGEILSQVLHFARHLESTGDRLTNVVFMGMGEPLHNYQSVWQAIRTLRDARGIGMGARRFVVSTAGVIPGIRRMAAEGLPIGLAVSLHAPDDSLRNELVPLNKAFPLSPLMTACAEYAQSTGRRITFEYSLMQEINDWPAQARALAELTSAMPRLINLIPLNPSPDYSYRPSDPKRARAFRRELASRRVPHTVRLRRGASIEAGCGQLRAHDSHGSVAGLSSR